MPIQPELKIFPQIVVPPPTKEEEIFHWALNMSRAYEEFTRQVFDKFNAHLDQTNAHYLSWAVMRTTRPEFAYSATDKVAVAASATQLRYFVVGQTLLEFSAPLVLDIDGTGPLGLDTGTKQPTTVYYLYGINNGGSASLIASTNAPATGPVGYTDWTYLGNFTTNGASQVPNPAPNAGDPTNFK